MDIPQAHTGTRPVCTARIMLRVEIGEGESCRKTIQRDRLRPVVLETRRAYWGEDPLYCSSSSPLSSSFHFPLSSKKQSATAPPPASTTAYGQTSTHRRLDLRPLPAATWPPRRSALLPPPPSHNRCPQSKPRILKKYLFLTRKG
ncbi:hypothetical protein GQ55_1G237000 [Panicum hallii var. hallii]|uniref:Uncharacterized protein n=1 Tax=Panicum hallii var. hallii TaxID=1504633 RepID=A0A2T7F6U6_9POAL|nr:hypothetical protein GQ55_1G237000 [Panicum hallii var. hallii]